jgi:uncharacterized protein YdaU (DUF1376 family)
MSDQPWFKFFASDYILDPKVDSLCLEAQAILIRMWSSCHIEGSCPLKSEETTRKIRLTCRVVEAHQAELLSFFETRDGRLYILRMEAEREKSEAAGHNANQRWRGNANRNAIRNANCNGEGNAQSQNQSHNQNQPSPPPKIRLLIFHIKAKGEESFRSVISMNGIFGECMKPRNVSESSA